MSGDRNYRCPVCGDDTMHDTECYERPVTADEMDGGVTNAGWCALNRYRWRLRRTSDRPFDDVLELQDGKNEVQEPDTDWVDRDALDPQWVDQAEFRGAPWGSAPGAYADPDNLYPRHGKPASVHDPSHGQIDRDIQWHVDAMRPSTLAQRVAMERTLQDTRNPRRSVLDAIGLSSAPTENQAKPDDSNSLSTGITGVLQMPDVSGLKHELARGLDVPEHLLDSNVRPETGFAEPVRSAAIALRQAVWDAYEDARREVEERLNLELGALGWGHLTVHLTMERPPIAQTPDHAPDPTQEAAGEGDGVVRYDGPVEVVPQHPNTPSTSGSNASSTEPTEPMKRVPERLVTRAAEAYEAHGWKSDPEVSQLAVLLGNISAEAVNENESDRT